MKKGSEEEKGKKGNEIPSIPSSFGYPRPGSPLISLLPLPKEKDRPLPKLTFLILQSPYSCIQHLQNDKFELNCCVTLVC